MAGYIIARVDVTDPEQYANYTAITPGVIAQYGGRFIVRAGEMHALEGPEEARRIVVIEFPSLADARTFYDSPEYQAARKLRLDASDAELIAVQGVE